MEHIFQILFQFIFFDIAGDENVMGRSFLALIAQIKDSPGLAVSHYFNFSAVRIEFHLFHATARMICPSFAFAWRITPSRLFRTQRWAAQSGRVVMCQL